LARSIAVLYRAEGITALSFNTTLFKCISCRTNLWLRLAAQLDHLFLALKRQIFLPAPARPLDLLLSLGPLNIKGPVINSLRPACPLKGGVRISRPCLPPTHKQIRRIPTAILFTKPVACKLPHGQHDMRMGLRLAITGARLVNSHVRNHAAINKFALHKTAQQLQALASIKFTGKRHFYLAGKLRITPLLDGLDRVPELVAIAHPVGRILGGHDLGMHNATLTRIVMLQSLPVIPQPPSRPVGGGCDR
jgi:hypothetical protein